MEVAGVDPEDHPTRAGFKRAVYDERGPGSWLDDMRLEVVHREAHGDPIPHYLEPLREGATDG